MELKVLRKEAVYTESGSKLILNGIERRYRTYT